VNGMWGWVMPFNKILKKLLKGTSPSRLLTVGCGFAVLARSLKQIFQQPVKRVFSRVCYFLVATALFVVTPVAVADSRPQAEDSVVLTVGWQTVAYSALVGYHACFAKALSQREALEQLLADLLLADEAKRYGFTGSNFDARPPVERGGLSEGEWESYARMHALAEEFLTFRMSVQTQVDTPMAAPSPSSGLAEAGRLDASPGAIASPGDRSGQRGLDYVSELRARSDVRINTEWLVQAKWYNEPARRIER
jgi:hypothetical protein